MSSQCQGVRFFKVIVESTLRRGIMKVPTSFVRRHWQGMSNPVTLSLPNGRKNKVYWVNKDGDVWFCNGWKEFAEYSKLDVSHFLVFGYEGNSLFNVIIFGKSGLEIEYPLSNDATNEEVEEIVEGSEFSAKLSEEGSKRPKEEVEEKEQQQSNKHSRKRACSDYSKHMNNERDLLVIFLFFVFIIEYFANPKNDEMIRSCQLNFRNIIYIKKELLLRFLLKMGEVGRLRQSLIRVRFFKVIVESTLRRGIMKVPTSFVRRHWQGMSNPVTLSLPNGRKNKVYWVNKDGDVWFCNGWKEFAEYSKLDVSHFLVFGYEGNSLFNVIIFGKSGLEIEYPLSNDATNEEVEEIVEGSEFSAKLSEEGSKRPKEEVEEKEQQQSNKHSRKRACSDYSKHMNNGELKKKVKVFHEKVKEMFNPKNTHFTSIIQQTYIERDLLIMPAEFSKHNLHKEGVVATLFVEDGRSWEVETKLNKYGQLTFFRGWRRFLLDNKLKVGDVCGFELLESPQFLFKVTIYPLKHHSTTPLFKGQKGVSHLPSSSRKSPVTTQARTPKPQDDLFICVKSGFPTIPFEYAKKYGEESGRRVTFRVGERSWKVKFLLYGQHSFARFSSGWFDFVRDCDLKLGDVCILRMLDQENLVFNVSCLKPNNSSGPNKT
ncbi:hypothetical protein DEO72_LG4g120 [Vigna unguiculata]|uniref:TF-B3 domain-containing protein n=1 Tax=Vigna unguiculata TaxID=3917 RepID=A0A4D6LKT4_VIGUN|nr:hypothetical protein DEO72_LG4g120 [Vigna unguiculata]